jgi:hypothetical protein
LKIQTPIDPAKLRAKEYKSLSDQMDSVIKTFAFLDSQGIYLGSDGEQLINDSLVVKEKYPKK